MFHTQEGRLAVTVWDDLDEPSRVAQGLSLERNRNYAKEDLTHSDIDSFTCETWLGAPSPEVFEERLSRGWPEGSQRLMSLAVREISPTSVRRRRLRSDQGDEVDMQAVWRGNLSQAWTRTRRMSRPGARSISLILSLGGIATVTADQLFWRGAAALRVASALVDAGYTVAIYGCSPAKEISVSGNMDSVQFVELKAEDQPLDVDKLAAISAMPGYFRSRLFAGRAFQCDKAGKGVAGGKGRTEHSLIAKAVPLAPIPQAAYVQPPIMDGKAAQAWIDTVMGEIEGQIED